MQGADAFLSRIGLPNATARVAGAGVSFVVLLALADLDRAKPALAAARAAVLASGDLLFVVSANLCLVVLAILALHPIGKLRLGADDEGPEFGTGSWLAMLFSAGLASGVLYWATAEPLLHAASNPFLASDASPEEGPREPLAKRLVDALAAGYAEGGDKREDLEVQSAALKVTTTEDRAADPYYDDLRVDATEQPIRDLRETYSEAKRGFELAMEKYAEAYEEDEAS